MGIMDKLMRGYEIWKIGKYTRRRAALTPEFEQRDKEYYDQNYKDGIYSHGSVQSESAVTRAKSIKRALSRKDTRTVRSSEVYNENPHNQFRNTKERRLARQVKGFRRFRGPKRLVDRCLPNPRVG